MNYQNEATARLFQAILSLNTLEECKSFFEDACTIKEILDIAQRFEVARMLTDKMSYQQISQQTGVSTATISRVNRCITYGAGGYKTAIERLKEQESAK